jgi:hypothetical protein
MPAPMPAPDCDVRVAAWLAFRLRSEIGIQQSSATERLGYFTKIDAIVCCSMAEIVFAQSPRIVSLAIL